MNAATIRRRFLDYFVAAGHREVASSSLVPAGDPTLLFTNAGMVQFKRVFLGLERRDYRRATTAQKCVRAGGKHNDLEQVGHTDRHHTFFEMLGNFSFGDYFKKDAIAFGWEFVTSPEWLGIHPDRIRVSVHHKDDDARRLWREVSGLPDARIYGLGDKDNFWQMAETGPCGPCSEIYVDVGDAGERRSSNHVHSLDEFVEAAEAGRFLEIWNLVFMQFDRQASGELVPLPAPSVDTGAGLERIAAVLQGVGSNFHTDLFTPLIARAEQVVGSAYDKGPAGAPFRVLADHARAVAFLLADGVYPSNEGRGYVLRRILRRAVRHAYLLGRREPTLVALVDEVVKVMGEPYPELPRQARHLADVTRAEEERFFETIEGGLERMQALTSVSAEEAFKLYDTYGFPIDLTQIVAAERGIAVDVAGFEKLLDEQRERSRAARAESQGGGRSKTASGPKGRAPGGGEAGRLGAREDRERTGRHEEGAAGSSRDWVSVGKRATQKWVGYDTTHAETDVLAFLRTEDGVGLVLHENPFYAESGGQVSDTGEVRGEGWVLPVTDVRKVEGRTAVFGPFEGPFEPPRTVEALVNEPLRRDTERNHTATHLLHAALRKRLGEHVRQAGSVVSPEHLRFDFTHHQPVAPAVLAEIEAEVNRHVWENIEVVVKEMPYPEALALGAMALFGEKYGDVVRTIRVPGVSLELCGGCHVRSTGQIGLVRIVGETGVGAGVRRIEALTGPGAYGWLLDRVRLLDGVADTVGSAPEHLARKVEALVEERKKLEKRVEELIKGGGAQAESRVTEVNGSSVAVASSASADKAEIGAMVDAFRTQTRSGVLVVVATGERPGIHVGVTDDLVARGVTAPDLANRLAALSGGKGGGRPHFASAGAGDATKLGEVERRASDVVREVLESRK
ncbi:MAG TPA: alanine--tRNA ligase [Gemmatimonadales bacterium]|nr:alanine--tRNA ligase [Gemmatimonadales bacterium]